MQTGKIYKGDTLISGGGSNGKSAYDLWLDAGHTGTEADFLASLQGNSGYSGAAEELEVVNNDTEGGPTAAWSAERGKVLVERLPNSCTVAEAGIYFVDESYNIGAYIDDDGFHAVGIDQQHSLDYEIIQ